MFNPINPIPFPPVIIVFAVILDLILGDPEWMPHPVRWMGRLITLLEKILRRPASAPEKERLSGIMLGAAVVSITYGAALLILYLAYNFSTPLYFMASTYLVWTCVSIKSLKSEARKVAGLLDRGALVEARKQLSRIVGRDTKGLSREAVLRATVETVSENASDGVIAPLFYLALGGPALMIAYKAVNTLDSMVGYKNERYINFGAFPAKLDDFANYLPARITSLLMVCASFILGYNWIRSFKVLVRDGHAHPSPNAGLPEAAVAGALGIRLGGGADYGGVFQPKPFIGDGGAGGGEGDGDGKGSLIEPKDVESSIRIMSVSAFMMVFFTFVARVIAIFLL
ncbi:MAG: adenosylcobinamide-phosphate synthase CbiB [Deltaproteobacteria bacterium]|nr:adenosylcobinamide-phosphate synthase CbiB [Deltaproteobacteria bacterium]